MKTLNIKNKPALSIKSLLFFALFLVAVSPLSTSQKVSALLTGGVTPTSLPSQGLVIHHTFDGKRLTTSSSLDSSGQGVDGTLQNIPSRVLGKIGQALSFDGSSQYVDLGVQNPLPNGVGTISVWVKLNTGSIGNNNYIIAKGDDNTVPANQNWGLDISPISSSVSDIYLLYGNAGWASSTNKTFHINKWNHLAVVMKSNNTQEFYINGELVGTDTRTTITPTAGTAIYIGRTTRGSPYQYHTNGSIDDIRVYNRPLSSKEVGALAGVQVKSQAASVNKLPASSGSLVGWWTLDGKDSTATTVADRSGNAITGTFSGSPTKIVGKVGQALYLNGSQYVNFGNPAALNFTGDMSASFWVKPAAFPGSLTVLLNKHSSGNAGFALQEQSGDMILAWGNGSYTCDTLPGNKIGTLTLGVWQHVAVVKSGTTVTGYINGVQSGSCTGAFSTIGTNGDSVLLGRWSSSNSRYFNGSFDDIYMYSRAISRSEIQTLYKSGQTTGSYGTVSLSNLPVSSGLVAYHTFDGKYMSGTTATDRAGSNTGTMTGGMSATSSARIGKVGQALYFDGQDDRLDLGSADLAQDTGFSLSFWAKNASSTSRYMTVRLKGPTSEFSFAVGDSLNSSLPSTFYFGFRGTGTSIRQDDSRYYIDTTVNKWNHYTVTYNGAGKTNAANWTLYVNGVRQTGLFTGANIGNFSNLSELGSDGPNGGLPSNYVLDDFRVYNRVLSSKEALTIYKSLK